MIVLWTVRVVAFLAHFVSYTFNGLLIYLVVRKKAMKMHVYIWNMVIAEVLLNLTQHIVIEIHWFSDSYGDRCLPENFLLQFVSYLNVVAYQYRYFLVMLMSLHRFFALVSQRMDAFFQHTCLVVYSTSIWVILVLVHMWLFFSHCSYRFNLKCTSWDINCPTLKVPITSIFSYIYVLPVFTSVINVSVVMYSKMRRTRIFVVSQMIPRLSKMSKAVRRTKENTLILHTLIISLIMSVDSIYSLIASTFSEEFEAMPEALQEVLGCLNVYVASIVNFLIYFVFNRYIRNHMVALILCRSKQTTNGKTIVVSNSL